MKNVGADLRRMGYSAGAQMLNRANLARYAASKVGQRVGGPVEKAINIALNLAGLKTRLKLSAAAGVFLLIAGLVMGLVMVGSSAGEDEVQAGAANPNASSLDVCGVLASNITGDSPSSGSGGYDATAISASEEANARAAYSVLKNWGMSDANIAGILGNWSVESMIDPTAVETVFDENYRIGPRKQDWWDRNFIGMPTKKPGEMGGIGLGQWSFGRNKMLRDYADSKNTQWYDIRTQLAFMLEADYFESRGVVRKMISEDLGSPRAAAIWFHDNWERAGVQVMDKRIAKANSWYAKMSNWSVDEEVIDGVNIDESAITTDPEADQGIVGGLTGAITGAIGDCLGVEGVPVVDENGEVIGHEAGDFSVVEGGMNRDQAQALINQYNSGYGERFLDAMAAQYGGPVSCRNPSNPLYDERIANCVSFSNYFINKFTTHKGYVRGNGDRTAYTLSQLTGRPLSKNPTPYSVGSGPGSTGYGHTMVVLGVNGDRAIVGEANYCSTRGQVREISISQYRARGWVWVDMSDALVGIDAA